MRFFFNHSYCPQLTVPTKELYIPTNVIRFYYLKKSVELTLKATILASLSVAIVWGGPPLLLISSAALILKLSTIIMNQFVPKDVISTKEKDVIETKPVELHALIKSHETNFSEEQFDRIELQKELTLYIIVGFVGFAGFAAGCAGLSWPVAASLFVMSICLLETSSHRIRLDADIIHGEQEHPNIDVTM